MTSQPNNQDRQVRIAAFEWLSEQVKIHGDVLPRSLLAEGFVFKEKRIPLISPQGIFQPKHFARFPLTITTTTSGIYDDRYDQNDLLLYRYRGTNSQHRDNVGLRQAMIHRIPLIYLHSMIPGRYLAVWPVFVVGDDPRALTFTVAADDYIAVNNYKNDDLPVSYESVGEGRRMYVTASVKQRLHQRGFRERVIHAYHEQCAFCRLKHLELLDAAHIIPDGEPGGEPIVKNGVSLCKLHHAAFDRFLIGIRPDYTIEVREDILREKDGPMLVHGIQSMHQIKMALPRNSNMWPNAELLERRYEKFKLAC